MAAGLWNPLDKHASVTLSESNRRAGTGEDWTSYNARAITGRSSGKLYFEILNITSTYSHLGLGNSSESLASGTFLGRTANSFGWKGQDGKIWFNNSTLATTDTWSDGAVIGFAVDFTAGTIACYLNNVLKYTATGLPAGTLYPMAALCYNSGARLCILASEQAYAAPSGFLPWGVEPITVSVPVATLTLTPKAVQIFPIFAPVASLTLTPKAPGFGQVGAIGSTPGLVLTPLAPTAKMAVSPVAGSLTLTAKYPSYVWAIPVNQRPAAQTIFICTLTGDGESPALTDLDLPMESFQMRLKADGPNYLSAVIPNAADYEGGINARANGKIVIRMGYHFQDDTESLEELARADFDDLRVDTGASNSSATISGYESTPGYTSPKEREIGHVSYRCCQENGLIRLRAKIDLFLRPGDTVIYGTDEFIVGEIVYYINATSGHMEVVEEE